jgi:hypothetical protein
MKLLLLIIINVVMASVAGAKEPIVIIRQEGRAFDDAVKGLCDELNGQFAIKEIIVDKRVSERGVNEKIRSINPKLVILMDNIAIGFYRKYQATLADGELPAPSISLLGVMINDAIAGLKNAEGISYEVPIVTSVISLRMIIGTPMRNVGVVYREFFKEFMSDNNVYCKKENIEITSIELPNKSGSYRDLLKKALVSIMEKKVEAIWVPNDNVILQPDLIMNVWIPMVKKHKIPVIVGVEALVTPQLNLGTFAVLPDHVALGSQAGGMVFDIMENNWIVSANKVDPPLAVYKIINLKQAKQLFNVTDEKLKSIDKKLE